MAWVWQWKAWLLAGATLVAGLGVTAVLYTGQRGPDPVSDEAASVAAPAPATDPAAVADPQPAPPVAPAFDVVRVAEDGGALVAGSALAGAAVVLRVEGARVAETSADNAGQFVALFTLAPSDSVQIMTLEMVLADGRVVLSDDRVVLSPRPEAVEALAEASPEPLAEPTPAAPSEAAPETVALAVLQPEPSDLPARDSPAALTPPPATPAQGHEAASGALTPATRPLETGNAVPADVVASLPPAPVQDSEPASAEARSVVENGPQDDVTAEPMPEASAEATIEPGTEAATGGAADQGVEVSVATRSATVDSTAETNAASSPRSPATDHAPDPPQAMVRVPSRSYETAPLASSGGSTPPTIAAPAPEPGLEAAAALLDTGRTGVETVAESPVTIGEAPEPATVDAAPTPGPEGESPGAEDVARAPEPAERRVPRAFVLRGSGEVDLLDRAPDVMDNVVVDMISYSDTGDVQISGRATSAEAGTRVQIYLDNRPVALALADNGDWASDLPAVDPGVYTLRVDQLDREDQVVSRFETPFQREDPARVRAARAQEAEDDAPETMQTAVALPPESDMPEQPITGQADSDRRTGTADATGSVEPAPPAGGEAPQPTGVSGTAAPSPAETVATTDQEPSEPGAAAPVDATATAARDPSPPSGAQQSVALMTVQPGHSLWRISEGHYGAGDRYLVIYNANRGQIRNPDLIYPGQIFVLPE